VRAIRIFCRALSSRGLAVILLLSLAAVALTGSMVAQLSAAGVRWAMPGPGLHPLIRILHLNDLFQATWALGLVGVLMLNLLLCSIARLRQPLLLPEQVSGLLHFRQLATAIPIDESWLAIEEELRDRRFHVRSRRKIGSILWSARRNRFGLAASVVFHLSLLIAAAGFILRARKGFDGDFVLFPDQTTSMTLAENDTIQVQLVSAGTDYDFTPRTDDLRPRQRRSELILYHNRQFERPATLSINHPVRIRGIRLFQSDPAQVFIVRLTPVESHRTSPVANRARSRQVMRHSEPLSPARDTIIRVRENERFGLADDEADSRHQYFFRTSRLGSIYLKDSLYGRLPMQATLVRLEPADSGLFGSQPVDTLKLEQPTTVGRHKLSLLNIRQGTRIAYRYDPALPWLFVAGAIFLMGILLRGFVPAYELSGTVTEEQGETVIRLGGRALGLFTSLRPIVARIADRFENQ
jgi:cytochrome c biogenesis protein ResB